MKVKIGGELLGGRASYTFSPVLEHHKGCALTAVIRRKQVLILLSIGQTSLYGVHAVVEWHIL
jgi:hypothetical protein